MERSTPAYRVLLLRDGQVLQAIPIANCDSDEEAIRRAGVFIDEGDVEVWDGPRKIGSMKALRR